eukprot:scaffold959_cov258-Pinguiococcus_pyrenoidosus.AAC.13
MMNEKNHAVATELRVSAKSTMYATQNAPHMACAAYKNASTSFFLALPIPARPLPPAFFVCIPLACTAAGHAGAAIDADPVLVELRQARLQPGQQGLPLLAITAIAEAIGRSRGEREVDRQHGSGVRIRAGLGLLHEAKHPRSSFLHAHTLALRLGHQNRQAVSDLLFVLPSNIAAGLSMGRATSMRN